MTDRQTSQKESFRPKEARSYAFLKNKEVWIGKKYTEIHIEIELALLISTQRSPECHFLTTKHSVSCLVLFPIALF